MGGGLYIDGHEIVTGYDIEATDDVTAGDDISAGDDLTVGGDLILTAGDVQTGTNANLDLVPNGTGIVKIGSGSPGHLTPTSGELYVQGQAEFDGTLNCDGTLSVNGQTYFNNTVNFGTNTLLLYNSEAALVYPSSQTVDSLWLAVGAASNSLIVAQYGDTAYNFAHTQQTNPTLYIHSANQSTTEWLGMTHDQTNGKLSTGAGGLDLAPAGNLLFTAGAAQKLDITATAAEHTNTDGLIDLDMVAGASGVVAIDSALTSPSAGLSSGTIYNINVNCSGDADDDASSYIYGFHANADAIGSAKKRAIWIDGANWEYSFYTATPLYLSATNIETDTTTGMQLATGATQKLGFFGATPVVRQTEITDELTTITHTAPGTPDYAIQDLTDSGPFGFVTKDEGNTVLSVIANLQARVNELETALVTLGLLADAD